MSLDAKIWKLHPFTILILTYTCYSHMASIVSHFNSGPAAYDTNLPTSAAHLEARRLHARILKTMRIEHIATAVVTTIFLNRLESDSRHNRRIENRRRLKAARVEKAEVEKLEGPLETDAQEDAHVPGKQLLAISLVLSLLVLLYLGVWRHISVAIFLACALFCTAIIAFAAGRLFPRQAAEEAEDVLVADELIQPDTELPSLTGTWIKVNPGSHDKDASSSMAAAMDLARLNRLVRSAVSLIKGMQIVHTEAEFEMTIFSFISWFKVREVYSMSGEESEHKRRDLRRGRHKGGVVVTPDGRLRLQIRWPDPLAGSGYDEFWLKDQNELRVHSFMEIGDQTARYTTVYRRKQ